MFSRLRGDKSGLQDEDKTGTPKQPNQSLSPCRQQPSRSDQISSIKQVKFLDTLYFPPESFKSTFPRCAPEVPPLGESIARSPCRIGHIKSSINCSALFFLSAQPGHQQRRAVQCDGERKRVSALVESNSEWPWSRAATYCWGRREPLLPPVEELS
jgi:hypothetical protein